MVLQPVARAAALRSSHAATASLRRRGMILSLVTKSGGAGAAFFRPGAAVTSLSKLRAAPTASAAGRPSSLPEDNALTLVTASSIGKAMQREDNQPGKILAALAQDSPATWEAFVRWASGPLWAACLRAAPRKASAEVLFTEIAERFHDERLALPDRFAASGLSSASAFIANEIDENIGGGIAAAFLARATTAADSFVRYFHTDIKTWVQRASAPSERGTLEDRVQDVYALLLQNGGRRLAAYPGGGSFRLFLRRLTLNALTDSLRRDHGRNRPKAAIARLNPLEQKAYRLLYEERLSCEAAIARLAEPQARDAVKTARALGDLGPMRTGARPRVVGLDDGEAPFDPPSPDRDPEAELIHLEDVALRTEREYALLAALRNEPPDVREILQLRFLDGLKPSEIADRLGRDRKDVYRVLERALARLKFLLARPS
ncbi:sigma-70 family RNA polymerase sigma factor [Mesorhizobium sp. B2-3-3]|nr:sigma-70 family RNA polymerase sigma factor [Mesorhizobium sp. B2-3-3]